MQGGLFFKWLRITQGDRSFNMDDQQILEHFPELMPYSPHIVDNTIRAYVTKSQFSGEFSHDQFRSLNKRSWKLGLAGIMLVHRPEEPTNGI
jgi:hypothetical protein